MIRHPFRKAIVACACVALAAGAASLLPIGRSAQSSSAEAATSQPTARGGTGLPLPRFASLKAEKTNVRRGPGQDYEVAFTFLRSGLPVEIVQEFDTWRKIRDSDGQEGWVSHGLLTGRRTAIVAPWETKGQIAAHRSSDAGSAVSAYLEPHVVTDVEKCTGTWCLVHGDSYAGWMEQEKLWGVYPNEDLGG